MEIHEATRLLDTLKLIGYKGSIDRGGPGAYRVVVTEGRLHDGPLTTGQASKVLGIPQQTLRRWSDQGRIPCERRGSRRDRYYSAAALIEMLERGPCSRG